MPRKAGEVCLLPGVDGEQDRVVLLLDDATQDYAYVLVLCGRVATREAGWTARLKGLAPLLVLLPPL